MHTDWRMCSPVYMSYSVSCSTHLMTLRSRKSVSAAPVVCSAAGALTVPCHQTLVLVVVLGHLM
eukprot:1146486-Pelagomonas_calceolata.AAC.3